MHFSSVRALAREFQLKMFKLSCLCCVYNILVIMRAFARVKHALTKLVVSEICSDWPFCYAVFVNENVYQFEYI